MDKEAERLFEEIFGNMTEEEWWDLATRMAEKLPSIMNPELRQMVIKLRECVETRDELL